jgi:hypothetical protein
MTSVSFTSVMQAATKHNLRALLTELSAAIASFCLEGAA